MPDFFEQVQRIWSNVKGHSAPLPALAVVSPERCWPEGSAGVRIRRDEAYVTLRVNEMYLDLNRQWYTVFDPLVLVVTEFNHGRQRVTIPYVVGPNLIRKQNGEQNPKHGSVVLDARVAGPFPYRGGDVDISIGFYQVPRANYAKTLLNMIEHVSDLIGGALPIGVMARTGAALLEGVDELLNIQGTVMLTGLRLSLATSPMDPLTTGFCAMIAPTVPQETNALVVRDRRLRIHDVVASCEVPYRASDYVLLGITGSASREDESLGPFIDMKNDALNALWDGADGPERAKANLITAYQQMRKSPDITDVEARVLFDSWLVELDSELTHLSQVRALPIAGPDATPEETRDWGTSADMAQELSSALLQVNKRLNARV
ncbi:hypothetical protein OKW38_001562 [Paraburkholderia sp. MM5496-R1]|uniref:hypothetical protein n=1 Tax=Paraburkholderia sp. MM5496-R1 TaxID=2991065 RepID=UPI003D1F0CAC